MGRNELSANAIAASTQRPYRCSENVSTYRTKRLRETEAIILGYVIGYGLSQWRSSDRSALHFAIVATLIALWGDRVMVFVSRYGRALAIISVLGLIGIAVVQHLR